MFFRYKVWQAIRASAAAPGYFDDFHVNRKIFQDGGVSCNNPSHIAIHEAQRLWPGEQLQCVVSHTIVQPISLVSLVLLFILGGGH